MKLLGHQAALAGRTTRRCFPCLLYWGLGSGKTLGALVLASLVRRGRILVLTDKSLVGQWVDAVAAASAGAGAVLPELRAECVDVRHYEALDGAAAAAAVQPRRYAMVICDESQRFRNTYRGENPDAYEWGPAYREMMQAVGAADTGADDPADDIEGTRPETLRRWLDAIRGGPAKVVYLSGTPIVGDPREELKALCSMMHDARAAPLLERVSHYDPRGDPATRPLIPSIAEHVVPCPLPWYHMLKYAAALRRSLTLAIDGNTYTVEGSHRGAFGSALAKVLNDPTPGVPGLSAKFEAILANLHRSHAAGGRQVVYSQLREHGVDALRLAFEGRSFAINGSMDAAGRASALRSFNRARTPVTLFLTDAARYGLDLRRVTAVHLTAPLRHRSEQTQVVHRAVRMAKGRGKDTVDVYVYVATPPAPTRDYREEVRYEDAWRETLRGMDILGEDAGEIPKGSVCRAILAVPGASRTRDQRHLELQERGATLALPYLRYLQGLRPTVGAAPPPAPLNAEAFFGKLGPPVPPLVLRLLGVTP